MSKQISVAVLALAGLALLAPVLNTVAPAQAMTNSSSPPISSSVPGGGGPDDGTNDTDNDNPGMNMGRDRNPTPLIACKIIKGQPDLAFRNIGDVVIPAGTGIMWQVPETGERGTYFIAEDIEPGHELNDGGVLAAILDKTHHCLSRLI